MTPEQLRQRRRERKTFPRLEDQMRHLKYMGSANEVGLFPFDFKTYMTDPDSFDLSVALSRKLAAPQCAKEVGRSIWVDIRVPVVGSAIAGVLIALLVNLH